MKKLAGLFEWLGFIIQYLAPIFLFSDIIPFIVQNPSKSLTAVGLICLGLASLFVWKKLKEKILQLPKSWWRALILSIPSLLIWFGVWKLLGTASEFIIKLASYWGSILIFIIVGRVFVIISEILHNVDANGEGSK